MLKVSIITVVKNRKDTIGRAIKSVQSQNYENIEHIIVDGNSTDGTIDVIKLFLNNKTIFISQNDKNMYEAINTGLNNINGEIFGLLHSDDYFINNCIISRIIDLFEKSDIDLIYGDVEFFNKGNITESIRKYSSKFFKPSLLKYGLIPAHPSIFMRKSLLNKVGNYDTNFNIAGDFEFLCRVFNCNLLKYYYFPETLIKMQTGGLSNVSLRNRLLINRELIIALKINNLQSFNFNIYIRYFFKIKEFIYFKLKLKN